MEAAKEAVQRLVQEYDEQFELYINMRDTARELQLLCQEGDFRDIADINFLNSFLEVRQLQMHGIEESQNTTAQLFDLIKINLGLKEVTGGNLAELYPSRETCRLKELINTLEPLLKEIVSLDGESQKHLNEKLGSLKEAALSLRKGRSASQLYKKPEGGQQEGIFIDEKKF